MQQNSTENIYPLILEEIMRVRDAVNLIKNSPDEKSEIDTQLTFIKEELEELRKSIEQNQNQWDKTTERLSDYILKGEFKQYTSIADNKTSDLDLKLDNVQESQKQSSVQVEFLKDSLEALKGSFDKLEQDSAESKKHEQDKINELNTLFHEQIKDKITFSQLYKLTGEVDNAHKEFKREIEKVKSLVNQQLTDQSQMVQKSYDYVNNAINDISKLEYKISSLYGKVNSISDDSNDIKNWVTERIDRESSRLVSSIDSTVSINRRQKEHIDKLEEKQEALNKSVTTVTVFSIIGFLILFIAILLR